ncbi:hypothetical protein Tco_0262596 [Tanacetum coccineum]
MASHRSNSLYAIKECMTCGSLYTRECCSIGSLEDKILTPIPDSSPCCAKCGTPVDGPYCRGCAFLQKKFEEDLLTYCGENETSKDFEDISESSDDNTNVVNAPREPIVVNQDPGEKFSQEPPFINQTCCYECGFDHPQPPQDSVDCQDALDKILEELKEIKRDRRKKIEDMSIEEMRHEQQLVDYKIKDITNDLSIKRFRGEEIDEEYERDCEIRIRELKQDFNEWGSEVRKKEQAYKEEQYAAAPDFDPNDDTSSDDDSFENIEYVDASPSYSLEEENEEQEEKEFDLEDILQIQDVILREKLLNVHRLISKIESLKDNPTPDRVLESPSPFPISVADSDSFLEESDTSLSHLDNSLPEFETFSDHTEERVVAIPLLILITLFPSMIRFV